MEGNTAYDHNFLVLVCSSLWGENQTIKATCGWMYSDITASNFYQDEY